MIRAEYLFRNEKQDLLNYRRPRRGFMSAQVVVTLPDDLYHRAERLA
jgi:hypothetical protein